MATPRELAADHIAHLTGAKTDVVEHNLGYATATEIRWARRASDAMIRAAAAQPADRTTPTGRAVNPFWYTSPVY